MTAAMWAPGPDWLVHIAVTVYTIAADSERSVLALGLIAYRRYMWKVAFVHSYQFDSSDTVGVTHDETVGEFSFHLARHRLQRRNTRQA